MNTQRFAVKLVHGIAMQSADSWYQRKQQKVSLGGNMIGTLRKFLCIKKFIALIV